MKIRLYHVSNSSSMSNIVIGRKMEFPLLEELTKIVKKDKLYAFGGGEEITGDGNDFFPVTKSMLRLWKKHFLEFDFYEVDLMYESESSFVTIPKKELPKGKEFSAMVINVSEHSTKTLKDFKKRYIHED